MPLFPFALKSCKLLFIHISLGFNPNSKYKISLKIQHSPAVWKLRHFVSKPDDELMIKTQSKIVRHYRHNLLWSHINQRRRRIQSRWNTLRECFTRTLSPTTTLLRAQRWHQYIWKMWDYSATNLSGNVLVLHWEQHTNIFRICDTPIVSVAYSWHWNEYMTCHRCGWVQRNLS